MTIELEDNDLKTRAERGRMRVFSLIMVYILLAVTVGAARSELQHPAAGTHQGSIAQANSSVSIGLR
jgi:hypothetical protein